MRRVLHVNDYPGGTFGGAEVVMDRTVALLRTPDPPQLAGAEPEQGDHEEDEQPRGRPAEDGDVADPRHAVHDPADRAAGIDLPSFNFTTEPS